jgi:hypothetical protein
MYGLIHNDKIQVGPRSWNYAFFKEYLDDNSLDSSTLSTNEPMTSIYGDDWKVLKVSEIDIPQIDSLFEMNVGPFWTIHENKITGRYNKQNRPLESIKASMRAIVASNRYDFEVSDVSYTFSDGQEVSLYMSREERNIYLMTYMTIGENETVPFKFKNEVFRPNVTKSELLDIVNHGKNHIKSAFEWEELKAIEINICETIEDLKLIELRHPSQIV